MSTPLPYGQVLLSYEEVRLLTERVGIDLLSKNRRNGGGTSPLVTLMTEIYMVACADPAVSAGDRLLPLGPGSPIDAGAVDPSEAYLSAQEAADLCGLPVRRVTELLKKGRLLGHQQVAKGSWSVDRRSLDRWAKEQTVEEAS